MDLYPAAGWLRPRPPLKSADGACLAAAARAQKACRDIIADIDAGLLSSKHRQVIAEAADEFAPRASTNIDVLRGRLENAKQALERQRRGLEEITPAITLQLELYGAYLERTFKDEVTTKCGNAVSQLVRLIRRHRAGAPEAEVQDDLEAASVHVSALLTDLVRGRPYLDLPHDTVTSKMVWEAVTSDDVEAIVSISLGASSVSLREGGVSWSAGPTVVGAAAQALRILGLRIPLRWLYDAVRANPDVQVEKSDRKRTHAPVPANRG